MSMHCNKKQTKNSSAAIMEQAAHTSPHNEDIANDNSVC